MDRTRTLVQESVNAWIGSAIRGLQRARYDVLAIALNAADTGRDYNEDELREMGDQLGAMIDKLARLDTRLGK